ncbi:MAG: hypothetical protein NTZ67_00255 [Gammaproteobacteria bacterium]|nr:hypothetical protein [Gammaproteobacteria bacterium]
MRTRISFSVFIVFGFQVGDVLIQQHTTNHQKRAAAALARLIERSQAMQNGKLS